MARLRAPGVSMRDQAGLAFSHADLLWLVGSLAQLHRIPADLDLLGREFPPPHDMASLHQALRAIGLTSSARRVDVRGISRLKLPCVVFLRQVDDVDDTAGQMRVGAEHQGAGARVTRLALLVKTDGERLLFFAAGSDVGETLMVRAFASRFEPRIIAVERSAEKAPAAPDETASGLTAAARPYGFRRLVTELGKHRHVFRDVVLASAAIQLIGLATPLFTQVVIDKVVVHQTLNTLAVVAVGLGLFAVFGAVMSWLRQYLVIHTGNRIDAVLAAEVFSHLMRLPYAYFRFRPTGTLVARLQAVESVREFVTGAAVALILDLPFAALFLAVMFFYSWQLSLIALALTGAIGLLSVAVTPRLRQRLNDQFLLGARNQAFVTEHVSSMETVKALQMEPQLDARYGDYLAAYLRASFRTRQLANSCNVTANFLEHAQVIALLVVGAVLVMENTGFTIGMLVAFQMFASRLSQPVLRLAGLYQQLQEAAIAVRRIADIMDAPAEPHTVTAQRAAASGAAAIAIRDLGFRYQPHLPMLFTGMSLDIPAGQAVAITGPSGSGKSTLANLLLGFYSPTAGRIQLDGIDIRHLNANALRRCFGVVPQETLLFSDTLHGNLLRANPNAGIDDVMQACKLAGIHDTIEALPKGYQTEIGERGVGLSGGQKQRIAIARALLKRPKILIFDEATASLDPDTAALIAQTINRLHGQVTIVFIAHQLPSALRLDRRFDLGDLVAAAGNNPLER